MRSASPMLTNGSARFHARGRVVIGSRAGWVTGPGDVRSVGVGARPTFGVGTEVVIDMAGLLGSKQSGTKWHVEGSDLGGVAHSAANASSGAISLLRTVARSFRGMAASDTTRHRGHHFVHLGGVDESHASNA
jgi:hypothetical protein